VEKLPDPPSRFTVAPDIRVVARGERLTRIYFQGGRHPTAWDAFRHFGPTSSRFDHHTPPRRSQRRGILYATVEADAFKTALAEVFQETRTVEPGLNDPWLAVFEVSRDLRLVDTSGAWPVRAGGNMAINSGSRAKARAWSRVIYGSYADVDGIWYPSSINNKPCIALYERAGDALPASTSFNEALNSPKLLRGILAAATQLNYVLR